MSYQVKRYMADGNNFIEDEDGGIIGVEFEEGTETYREMCVNFSMFDLANRTAIGTFIRHVKSSGGSWGYKSSYSKNVDDFSGGVSITPEFFGQMDADPYEYSEETSEKIPILKPWKWQMKPGLISEAQFFIDTIIKNKYGVPVDISAFIVSAIVRHNNLEG